MATITRSVHSISFFLCLPRLFHPLVLATVLGDRRAHVLYRAMLTLFLLSNVHRVFIRFESLKNGRNTFDIEYTDISRVLTRKTRRLDRRMFRSSERIGLHQLLHAIFYNARINFNLFCFSHFCRNIFFLLFINQLTRRVLQITRSIFLYYLRHDYIDSIVHFTGYVISNSCRIVSR